MKHLKITLYTDYLMTLEQKKKIIDSMFGKSFFNGEYKKGFFEKFNNAIGFKDYGNSVFPDNYLSPEKLLMQSLRTPLDSFNILEFYIPNKTIEHFQNKYTYKTVNIAKKWAKFLKVVFPTMNVTIERINEIPELSVKEYALQEFFMNISKNEHYNIEFSISRLLTKAELKYIIPKIQLLANEKITIAQYECDTCREYHKDRPYHIEIVYLTWHGEDVSKEEYRDYGNTIFVR